MGHPKQIPLLPQTDPDNFPKWEAGAPPGKSGHGYPKMLVRPFTADDRQPWLDRNKQTDPVFGREFYLERCPKVGDMVPVETTQELVDAGFTETIRQPVICKTAEDEREIKRILGIAIAVPVAEAVVIPFADPESAVEKLKRENAELTKLIAENKRLKADKETYGRGGDMPAEEPETPKQPRRRRKRRPVASRPKTLEEFAKA